jgi:hypothetical protein
VKTALDLAHEIFERRISMEGLGIHSLAWMIEEYVLQRIKAEDKRKAKK